MLHDVILTQQREFETLVNQAFVPRTSVRLPESTDLIRVVTGPRRAGKSALAAHWASRQAGGSGYVNFDDERLPVSGGTDALLAAVDAVYNKPGTLLFDEIQNLPRWELLVNRLHRAGRKLILTGSNANLLSSELATHLTGRHLATPLLPFSFPEFVAAKGEIAAKKTTAEMLELCLAFARVGGFPEVVIKSLPVPDYLRTLFSSVIYKDIVARFRLRAPQAVEKLATYLLSQPGAEYSFRGLAQVTGCRSPHTLQKYLGFLEQAFLVFSIPRFSFKVREQAASNKKAYAIDTGLAEAVGISFSPNRGRLLENLVAQACYRRQLQGEMRVYYWKDPRGSEADFVLQRGHTVESVIQVSLDAESPKVRTREIRGLLHAGQALRCSDLLLLTGTGEEGESVESWHGYSAAVRHLPVWKWLLSQESAP